MEEDIKQRVEEAVLEEVKERAGGGLLGDLTGKVGDLLGAGRQSHDDAGKAASDDDDDDDDRDSDDDKSDDDDSDDDSKDDKEDDSDDDSDDR